ncbi:phospholipase D-like domain-containing protein [Lentibacillus sediminis]|uniref:phospholipase D-like domain-containing protein n=1 Tax=Lentibacillus sediminis TaxID=1940529 RepID=UPI000C1BBA6D|nr:phospholipase D-like domain-containing protein [Lentibacillus sediminis]
MRTSKKLQKKIVHFVSVLVKNNNQQLFDTLVLKLKENELAKGYEQICYALNFPFELDYLIYEVFEEANENGWKSSDLVNSLEIAYQAAVYQLNSQPGITPVWTGPTFDTSFIQFQTYETVKQLIGSAKNEIFIVGYNFSFKQEIIRTLLKELESAAERKCRINIIVNDKEENYNEIRLNWSKEQYLLNIYSWKGTDQNDYASLHAKLLIIDQKKLFLTSANFSYHGFMRNIETGIVIENHDVIREIWMQYHSLLRNNQIKKVY